MNQNEPIKVNLPLNQTLAIVCEQCDNDTFTQVAFLRRASKFLTGATQDTISPIPTFACTKCSNVNQEFQLNIADKTEE